MALDILKEFGLNKELSSNDEQEFDRISFHHNVMILPSCAIQIKNISRISKHTIKNNNRHCGYAIIIAIISCLAYFFSNHIAALIISVTAVFFAFKLYKKNRYGIIIETNGKTRNFVITKTFKASMKLYAAVMYAMSKGISQTVTIDHSMNIVSGDQIMGDQFKDIQGNFYNG